MCWFFAHFSPLRAFFWIFLHFCGFFRSFYRVFKKVFKRAWICVGNYPQTLRKLTKTPTFIPFFRFFHKAVFRLSCGKNKKKSDFFESFKTILPPTSTCGFSRFFSLGGFSASGLGKNKTFRRGFKAFSNEFLPFRSCIIKFTLHKSFGKNRTLI